VAGYQAIAAITQALRALLANAAASSEFATARFELFQAESFQRPPDHATLSIYLYRVTLNSTGRNLPPRPHAAGERQRPAVPLDLSCLLTAWARDIPTQQRLLAWCVREIENSPVLPAARLNPPAPEPAVFRPDEAVELVFEPLSLQDLAAIWQIAPANQQPSVAYSVRMVAIESRPASGDGGSEDETADERR
jgi:hypothetical protein